MDNKVALVTGASSGIGKHTAMALIKDGYTVYAAARRIDRMDELSGQGVHCLAMDITVEEDIQQVVETIQRQHGGVDILINNAGYATYGSVEETSIDDARRQFEVNLFGLARLTQLLIPHMRERGAGKILNMSSMGGKVYTPLGAWYHATKYALEGWSDCLRLELSPFGIDVIIIEPGIIMTEFADVMMEPLLKRSGNGPYGNLANFLAQSADDAYNKGKGTKPEVVAKVISKAIKASKPKTRYAVGSMAKPMMFIKKWFGDRLYDRAIMSQIK